MHLQKTVWTKSLAFELVVSFVYGLVCTQTKRSESCLLHVRFHVVGLISFNDVGCIKVQGLEKFVTAPSHPGNKCLRFKRTGRNWRWCKSWRRLLCFSLSLRTMPRIRHSTCWSWNSSWKDWQWCFSQQGTLCLWRVLFSFGNVVPIALHSGRNNTSRINRWKHHRHWWCRPHHVLSWPFETLNGSSITLLWVWDMPLIGPFVHGFGLITALQSIETALRFGLTATSFTLWHSMQLALSSRPKQGDFTLSSVARDCWMNGPGETDVQCRTNPTGMWKGVASEIQRFSFQSKRQKGERRFRAYQQIQSVRSSRYLHMWRFWFSFSLVWVYFRFVLRSFLLLVVLFFVVGVVPPLSIDRKFDLAQAAKNSWWQMVEKWTLAKILKLVDMWDCWQIFEMWNWHTKHSLIAAANDISHDQDCWHKFNVFPFSDSRKTRTLQRPSKLFMSATARPWRWSCNDCLPSKSYGQSLQKPISILPPLMNGHSLLICQHVINLFCNKTLTRLENQNKWTHVGHMKKITACFSPPHR